MTIRYGAKLMRAHVHLIEECVDVSSTKSRLKVYKNLHVPSYINFVLMDEVICTYNIRIMNSLENV